MKGRYWTAAQRQALETELRETGDAALFRRLLALLEIDQGRSVTQVAQALRVGRSSVCRWAQRYAAARQARRAGAPEGPGPPAQVEQGSGGFACKPAQVEQGSGGFAC